LWKPPLGTGAFSFVDVHQEEGEKVMPNRYRRYSKRELLGSLHVDYVMSVTDLGLTPKANRWDALRAFLKRGSARAERLVEESGGFLLLQSIPGRPNTGAIYAYVEHLQAFFWLRFEQKEDALNGEDFQNALRVHHLVKFVSGHSQNPYRRRCPNRETLPAVIAVAAGAAQFSTDQGAVVAAAF
jgi:hypothetical protein